jgi:hypothetical protein
LKPVHHLFEGQSLPVDHDLHPFIVSAKALMQSSLGNELQPALEAGSIIGMPSREEYALVAHDLAQLIQVITQGLLSNLVAREAGEVVSVARETIYATIHSLATALGMGLRMPVVQGNVHIFRKPVNDLIDLRQGGPSLEGHLHPPRHCKEPVQDPTDPDILLQDKWNPAQAGRLSTQYFIPLIWG